MAESYSPLAPDVRNFGQQIARLKDDLNRPDLSNIVTSYLQDAQRFFARLPFFFNDTDNANVGAWAADTIYPQGATATFVDSGSTYIIAALNKGLSGAVQPTFTTNIFVNPTVGFPPPVVGTLGTTEDNTGPPTGLRWATIENITAANHTQNFWTQLSTVYAINQYQPPIDYVAPRLVEVTASNLRYPLIELSYPELRNYDVIRPSPITVYPQFWAWYQQQIYVWPYPNGFYPLTLSYRCAPTVARNVTDVNVWTTQAEALVRGYAAGLIQEKVLYDDAAANACYTAAMRELRALQSQSIAQESTGQIPIDLW